MTSASDVIPTAESLTVEFKSDRERLSDDELIATVVCLANTDGGEIYLGVEDDRRVTGLHTAHQHVGGLPALVANRTVPPVGVRVSVLDVGGQRVARIEVPRASGLVARSDGLLQRRRMQADGRPACVPMYPYEIDRREADLGLVDYSARAVPGVTRDDFDSIERERLRRAIERYGGDRALLSLADEELDGALGLTRRVDGIPVPTVTGLLLIGRAEPLAAHMPTHEVAFQELSGLEVRVNAFYRGPLLSTVEAIEGLFGARIVEEELLVGMFRVAIPNYAAEALREALANALVHRDYTRLGAAHVRWLRDAVEVGSPGGFPEGVSTANLLVTEPRPRNRLLADVFKRIGLVERTGRGIDTIYRGQLRYGRPAPDYTRSDATTVVVRLENGPADRRFVTLVIEEEGRRGEPLPIDDLVVLAALRTGAAVGLPILAALVQRTVGAAAAVVDRLAAAGLVTLRGADVAALSDAAAMRLGGAPTGLQPVSRTDLERAVLRQVDANGRVSRREVAQLTTVSPTRATRLLEHLVEAGLLVRHGSHRGTFYERRT